MRKVLIAGDSLSMSRHGFVNTIDTYAAKLQMLLDDTLVVNAAQRGCDSERLLTEEYLLENIWPLQPDHIVIQVGIVDCTPRLFTQMQKRILSAMQRIIVLRNVANVIIRTASSNRYAITKKKSRPLVPRDRFESNLRAFIAETRRVRPNCSISLINIPCPGGEILGRNWGILELVNTYNGLISAISDGCNGNVVDLYELTRQNHDFLLADGYHIDSNAHNFICVELERIENSASCEPV
mgnify:CR=1 FL=1